MVSKAKFNVDVNPKISSAVCNGPFGEAYKRLGERGYEVISLEENALLRMQEGIESPVCKQGNYTRECIVYTAKEGPFLARKSPILSSPETAAKAAKLLNEKSENFYLSKEEAELALKDAIKIEDSIDLREHAFVDTNSFGDNEVTKFAFGKYAAKYGRFLRNEGIGSMHLCMMSNQGKRPFVRQVYFQSIKETSEISGCHGLGDNIPIRGISRVYSPNQIKKSLKKQSISGMETQLLQQLNLV